MPAESQTGRPSRDIFRERKPTWLYSRSPPDHEQPDGVRLWPRCSSGLSQPFFENLQLSRVGVKCITHNSSPSLRLNFPAMLRVEQLWYPQPLTSAAVHGHPRDGLSEEYRWFSLQYGVMLADRQATAVPCRGTLGPGAYVAGTLASSPRSRQLKRPRLSYYLPADFLIALAVS